MNITVYDREDPAHRSTFAVEPVHADSFESLELASDDPDSFLDAIEEELNEGDADDVSAAIRILAHPVIEIEE